MPGTAQADSAIGWILAALLALHFAFAISAAPARAEAGRTDLPGWDIKVSGGKVSGGALAGFDRDPKKAPDCRVPTGF